MGETSHKPGTILFRLYAFSESVGDHLPVCGKSVGGGILTGNSGTCSPDVRMAAGLGAWAAGGGGGGASVVTRSWCCAWCQLARLFLSLFAIASLALLVSFVL